VIDSLTGQGLDVGHACRMLRVSRSGFYAWRDRPASPRALRHLSLAGEIIDVHRESGRIYGERRVAAELRHGRGIIVNSKTVTSSRAVRASTEALAQGCEGRAAANRLWMTDITERGCPSFCV
jgi:putative transposase